MPAAAMTTGTIIGEISSAGQGIAGLDRPMAATVPRVVASKVAETPTMRVFRAALRHRSPSSTCSYQRSE